MTAGIILSAGASSRMGAPKAQLPFRGGTFLTHLCNRLAPFCDPLVVVVGADAGRISCPPGTLTVVNAQWPLGQLSSLQCGLRALTPGMPVLFTLVDHPDPAASTIARLVRSSAPIAVPVAVGRKGHPVLLQPAIAAALLALPPTASAKDVFALHAESTDWVSVDDPGILDDVDDPAALAVFRSRTEHA